MNKNLNSENIQDWLIGKIAEIQEISEDQIDINQAFSSFGMDSVATVEMSGELEEWLTIKLEPTTLYEYSTIKRLSDFLVEEIKK